SAQTALLDEWEIHGIHAENGRKPDQKGQRGKAGGLAEQDKKNAAEHGVPKKRERTRNQRLRSRIQRGESSAADLRKQRDGGGHEQHTRRDEWDSDDGRRAQARVGLPDDRGRDADRDHAGQEQNGGQMPPEAHGGRAARRGRTAKPPTHSVST